MKRHRAQDSDHVRQEVLHRLQRGRFRRLRGEDLTTCARDQRVGDLRGAEHEIDRASCDSAPRHAVIVGFAHVLGDDEAAFRLYGLQANTAVGAGSGKDHTDSARSVFESQRIEEEIERKSRAMSSLRLRNPQSALVVDRQIDAWRNDIYALAFDRHSVGRLQDRHRRVARKKIHHHAVVARVEMLHDDEGHAVVGRQPIEKLPAGVKASGRSADRDDRIVPRFAGRDGLRDPARSLPLNCMLAASRHSAISLEQPRPGGTSTKH